MSTQEIIDAIINERLDYLESMLITSKNNFPVASYQWAIRYDKESVIRLLLKHDFPKGCEDCSTVARCNNLTLLKLLRDNNFPWRFGVMIHAIENDNMEMLKYAIENNCPWSQLALELDYAEKFKRVEMLRYLKEHKCGTDIKKFLYPN